MVSCSSCLELDPSEQRCRTVRVGVFLRDQYSRTPVSNTTHCGKSNIGHARDRYETGDGLQLYGPCRPYRATYRRSNSGRHEWRLLGRTNMVGCVFYDLRYRSNYHKNLKGGAEAEG